MAERNRYSQVVALVKVLLPLLALALLSTLFLFSRTPDPERAIPFAEVDVEELAREQRLTQPRFAGTLEDGREILFVAQSAAPIPDMPDQVAATSVEARIALSDTDYVLLSAEDSLVHLDQNRADLEHDVLITSSTGYRIRTERLLMGLNVLNLDSPGPVEIDGPSLLLTAGSMTLSGPEGAQVLIFNGGVTVVYEPGS